MSGQGPRIGQTLASYSPAHSGVAGMSGTAAVEDNVRTGDKPGRFKRALHSLRTKRFWKRFVLVLLAIIIIVGGWLGFKFYHDIGKIFHGNIFGFLHETKLRGEDSGHVNILLAGNSADDKGHNGAQLTDSIMIISINTKDHSGFMMSIPRDLWVDIPNNGHAKINEAYVDGQDENFNQAGYFPGGMGLLQEVVQQNFGIKINYYALVNYAAMRDAVNAVGGIDVTINSCDPRGLYDPNRDYVTNGPLVNLSNGKHHLNGEQALDLARARGDPSVYGYSYGFCGSDFDRTQHQREELLALRQKITSAGVLTNPLKLSSLLDALGNNVKTDFTTSEMRRLYDLTKDINGSGIKSVGLNNINGKDLLQSYTSPLGQSALVPAAGMDNFSAIEAYINRLLSNSKVAREGANVIVLNATNTSGLAAKASKTLGSKGIAVSQVADASALQSTTTIIDASKGKMPATKALLTKLYGQHVTTTNPYANVYDADFIVVLGADQVPATTTSTQP